MLKRSLAIGLTWPMFLALLGFHMVSTVFEGIGLTILLPVFHLLQSGETPVSLATDSKWWRMLVDFYAFFGLSVTIPLLLVTSFMAILFRQVMIYFRLVYAAYVKFTVIRRLRDRVFRAFLRARLGYGESEGLGRIINDVTTEAIVAVEGAITVVTLFSMLLLALVYLCILFALSVEMTLAAMAVLAVALLPVIHFVKRGQIVGKELVGANSALLNFLSQRIRHTRLVRLSGMEEAEFENMRSHTQEQYKQLMKGNVLRARTTAIIEPFAAAAGFSILYFGVIEFGLSLEQIGLFLVIIIRLVPVVKELANVRYAIANQLGSVSRVLSRLSDLENEQETDLGDRTDVVLQDGVRFDNVYFSYDNSDEYALRGVNVEITAKKVTALVGPSGSGKSTLIDMLPHLRVPTSGGVFFDNVPIEEFELRALRQAISYAPQSPQIFNVSAREHIHYGQPDASPDAIERAAKLAGAHDFIMDLPHGYDTVLSEAGARLSGGQRQRLDLARTLLKPAKILILDEPTSQLDADSELKFREALARIKRETDLTIVIVGHRFSTLSIADQIIVLNEGSVVDVGTHSELINCGGWYASAFDKQSDHSQVPDQEDLETVSSSV